MDPYLEQTWGDVHARLIMYAADSLRRQLPTGLVARTQERVVLEHEDVRLRDLVPDINLRWRPPTSSASGWSLPDDGGVALEEPLKVAEPVRTYRAQGIEITEGYVEIIDLSGGKVVTIIEVLSPTYKNSGQGSKVYREKRNDILDSDVNLVEIDLLRSGQSVLPAIGLEEVEEQGHLYEVLISQMEKTGKRRFDLYALPLRKRLPNLPIPLRIGEEPVILNLQSVFELCYENGSYEQTVDYSRQPVPPLSATDAAWAGELLKARGIR